MHNLIYKTQSRNGRGFTLIELLVVIAIIGLLSSIVLASLNVARKKAKDAAIKREVSQLANLMALEYNDSNSYCNLQLLSANGWITDNIRQCSDLTVFTGNYAANARQICSNIFKNAADDTSLGGSPGQYKIYASTNQNQNPCASKYSFMVFLNNNKWYCSGSSGTKGEYATYSGNPGCYNNP